MNHPLNILFLASWYPNKLKTKNGNFIQQHALAVSKFCKVSCLHTLSSKQENLFEIEEKNNNGVFEVIVYYKKINSNFPVISKYLKLKRQIEAYQIGYQKIIEHRKKIDLLHLNVMYPAGLFAMKLNSKFKLPYIATEHWTGFLPNDPIKISFLEHYFIKKIMNRASTICPVSVDLMKAIKDISSNKNYEVVPNVVNTEIFKHKIHETEKRILHVSNLKDEHKNIIGIIDTIKELSLLRDDFFISIIGDGDYNYFIRYAEKIKLPKHLYTIEGAKSYQEIATLMQTHDLFLLYSNYENLPCVIAEALVCGLPVLTSDVGGTSEMVNETNGRIVSAKNNKQLLNELNNMLDNLGIYNNNKIADDAAKKYSYDSVGKQFFEIYKKVLNI